mgnify:CR=1 FL=1
MIDAVVKLNSSFVKYANSADYSAEQNAEFQQIGDSIFLVALGTPIAKGVEILTWYGTNTRQVVNQR